MAKKNIAQLLAKNLAERDTVRREFDFPDKILHPTIEKHVFEKGKRYQHWWEILAARRDELTLHMCGRPDDLTHIAELYLVAGQDNTRASSGTSGAEIEKAVKHLTPLGYVLRGTLHSHPGMGCFFSGMDHTVNKDTLDALKGSHYELVKSRKVKIFDDIENLKLKSDKEIRWNDYFSGKDFLLRKTDDGKAEFCIEENNYVGYVYAVVIDGEKHICGMLSQRISNDLDERFPVDTERTRPGKYLQLKFVETQEKNWTDEQLIIDIIEKQGLDPIIAINRIEDNALKMRLFSSYAIPTKYPVAISTRQTVGVPTKDGLKWVVVADDSFLAYTNEYLKLNFPEFTRKRWYVPKKKPSAPVLQSGLEGIVVQKESLPGITPHEPVLFAKPGQFSSKRKEEYDDYNDKTLFEEIAFMFPVSLVSYPMKWTYDYGLRPLGRLCKRAYDLLKKNPDYFKPKGDKDDR